MMAKIAHAILAPLLSSRRLSKSIQMRTTAIGCRKQIRSSIIFFTLVTLPRAREVIAASGRPEPAAAWVRIPADRRPGQVQVPQGGPGGPHAAHTVHAAAGRRRS